MSNFEGGIRVASFVGGGIVPAAKRGSKYNGLVAIYDWSSPPLLPLAFMTRANSRT